MADAAYNDLLSRVEAEYNAEQQRLAEIKAEEERQRIAEQERIRLEREDFARQRAEFEKREADLKELRDKELQEQQYREAKVKAEQDKKEAELRAERAKLEAERRELELQQRERAAAERAKIEEHNRIIREAEEKAEGERLAELKRQRQESLKPDKQKLFDLATRLMQVEFPELASDEAKTLLREVAERIAKLSEFIHDKAQQS
jgi:hypothetical protein